MSADERDRQATPPSGSKAPDDATAEPSDQPRGDDVPTPWELKEKEKAESGGDGEATTTWVRDEDGNCVRCKPGEIGQQPQKRQHRLGDAEAAGGGDVDGASG